jgi:hypothetical protein
MTYDRELVKMDQKQISSANRRRADGDNKNN